MNYCKLETMKCKNVGEMYIGTNLKHTVLQCADYFFYYYQKPEKIKFLNQYIVNIASFYELFFKFKMSLIDKSLIWDDPKQFDINKHSEANFKSINANKTLKYAKNNKWIDDKTYSLLLQIFQIRNKIAHFSLCDNFDTNHCKFAYIPAEFDNKNYNFIRRLLLENEKDLKDDYLYFIIKKEYLLIKN